VVPGNEVGEHASDDWARAFIHFFQIALCPQGAGRRMGFVGSGNAPLDMGIRVAALADVALKAFAEFAQVVPESGQGGPGGRLESRRELARQPGDRHCMVRQGMRQQPLPILPDMGNELAGGEVHCITCPAFHSVHERQCLRFLHAVLPSLLPSLPFHGLKT